MVSEHVPSAFEALTLSDVDARTIERHPRATVVPASLRAATSAARVEPELELLDTIGEGGMGVVRRGVQRALGREVAVKALRHDHKDETSASKLLREARVTGRLEHPNVIPVYDIAEEDDGAPLIVLKKVEGIDWSGLMHDAVTVTKRFGTDDLLEWNLRILVQVCNAVSFAHSRGVLHRDLKPENVMIGKYGEVYLVDWGIAVGLDGAPHDLPRATDALEMAGTPAYMAPEMLGGGPSRLSERSDVYLLGGILYEIVSRSPPHTGTNIMAIIHSITESRPPMPSTVPAELARIIRRAMDADPDARFEQATQLRLAIEGFLRHRSAAKIARDAEERLARLQEQIARSTDESDHDLLYGLYGECRFGLRHALEAWPGNAEIEAALALAATEMIELELERGDPRAARVLMRDLDEVPPELEARVTRAQALQEREYGELRRLQQDLDPRLGRNFRQAAFMVLAIVWVGWPLSMEALRHARPEWLTPLGAASAACAVSTSVLAVVWYYRKPIFLSAINRRLGFAAVLTVALQLAWCVVAMIRGDPVLVGMHQMLLTATGIVAMLAAGIHWGLLVASVTYLVGYIATAWIGIEHVLYVTSATNLVLFLNLYALLSWATSRARS